LQDFPAVAEVDINPLIVLEKGALAVDARIVLKHERREGTKHTKR
jgi:hypothetical protein